MSSSVTEALRVGIVGATGVVGRTLLGDLENSELQVSEVRLFGRVQSSEKRCIAFGGAAVPLEGVEQTRLDGLDIVFLCAGGDVSRELAPSLRKTCGIVIDSSSAFRHHEDVPLVIPEINGEQIKNHTGLIANPNCSTAIALMALSPLQNAYGLRRVIATTYQAVSGAGQAGLDELSKNARADAIGGSISTDVFGLNMSRNILPLIGLMDADGETEEEAKLRFETRRILGVSDLKVQTTCVRVPTMRVHGVALTVELESPVECAELTRTLAEAKGVVVVESRSAADCPNPRGLEGRSEIVVTRLRRAFGDPRWVSFFCLGDQLKKGAATNAVQIATLWQQMRA